MTTAELVRLFQGGKSCSCLAQINRCKVEQIEEAIRRWMQLYPKGKGK